VILAYHVSMWGPNHFPTSSADPIAAAHRAVSFYKGLQAPFDMLFFETSDADAAYQVLHPERWSPSINWWFNDAAYAHYQTFINIMHQQTGLRSMLWQMPIGNTLYATMNNTLHHYQD